MAARRSAARLNGALLALLEIERRRIYAIAKTFRTGAVREDVTEMAVTGSASDFGPDHAMAVVLVKAHLLAIGWAGEARPAAAAVELGAAVEQKLAAAGAAIAAFVMIVPVEAGEGALGAALAEHLILFGREAPAPFLVGQIFRIHDDKVGIGARRVNADSRSDPVDWVRTEVVWRDFADACC